MTDRIDVEELVEALDRAETELSALKALVGRMVEGLEVFGKVADNQRSEADDALAAVLFTNREARQIASLLSEAKGLER